MWKCISLTTRKHATIDDGIQNEKKRIEIIKNFDKLMKKFVGDDKKKIEFIEEIQKEFDKHWKELKN